MRRLLVAFVALMSVAGCTTIVTGEGSSTGAANAQLKVVNTDHGAFDQTVQNSLADVEAFWKKAYPSISGGAAFPPLAGGYYSVDSDNVTPAVLRNDCIQADHTAVVDNAQYCRLDDSVDWDRNPNHLVPVLGRTYGQLLVAVVFAHEFGHAVQNRLGILKQKLPTVDTESQADCAAGAFVAYAQQGHAPHFSVTASSLQQALVGYLQVRDPAPTSSAGISHGNGFDRLGAVTNGIDNGVKACFASDYPDTLKLTERPYTTDADYLSGGNETYQQVIDASPSKTDGTGGGGLQPDLNRFWTAAAKTVNKTWTPVTIAEAAHPACGASATSEFGYCPDDNTVYYASAFAQQAYNSVPDLQQDQATGNISVITDAPGDYALGTLFVYGWGLAVRHQLFGGSTQSQAALLAATCYAGAYSKDINIEQTKAHAFTLSPPDMDEAVSAILSLVPLDQAYGAQGTTGLQRIQSFRKGYFGGLSTC